MADTSGSQQKQEGGDKKKSSGQRIRIQVGSHPVEDADNQVFRIAFRVRTFAADGGNESKVKFVICDSSTTKVVFQNQTDETGNWNGELEIPFTKRGAKLDFEVEKEESRDSHSCSVTLPQPKSLNIPLIGRKPWNDWKTCCEQLERKKLTLIAFSGAVMLIALLLFLPLKFYGDQIGAGLTIGVVVLLLINTIISNPLGIVSSLVSAVPVLLVGYFFPEMVSQFIRLGIAQTAILTAVFFPLEEVVGMKPTMDSTGNFEEDNIGDYYPLIPWAFSCVAAVVYFVGLISNLAFPATKEGFTSLFVPSEEPSALSALFNYLVSLTGLTSVGGCIIHLLAWLICILLIPVVAWLRTIVMKSSKKDEKKFSPDPTRLLRDAAAFKELFWGGIMKVTKRKA